MQEEMDKGKIKRITIDQKKLNTLSAELNEITENLQNKIVIEKNVALAKNSMAGDFKSWKESKKVEETHLKKQVNKQIVESKKILDTALLNTIKQINETGEEITAEQIKEFKGVKIFETANHALELTGKNVIKNFKTDVINVYKLRNQEPLFNAIMKQSNAGIENGVKIAYRNGKEYSFRSYMEMNVRTTVRQEANSYLFKASRSNGVVFYLSNYFSDSADDHADFQNRYYFDENWKSFGYDEEISKKIEKAISRYHMISYQDVTEKPPYLTTRPNCRHVLKPVLLDDVFNKTPVEAGKDYGMRKGTYKSKNYKDLQTQRLNERNIRKYKARLENDLRMQKEMNSPQMAAQIEEDKRRISFWQNRQRQLIAKNSVLKRDYRRENPKIVVFDAGARYNKGIVPPQEPTKTPAPSVKTPKPSAKTEVIKENIKIENFKKEKLKLAPNVRSGETPEEYLDRYREEFGKERYNKQADLHREYESLTRKYQLADSKDKDKIYKESVAKLEEASKATKEMDDGFFIRDLKLSQAFTKEKANKENFFKNSIGIWQEDKLPKGKSKTPDYVSYSRKDFKRNGEPKVSSEYWYTEEGVYRRSDHWGINVASCNWVLTDGETMSGSGKMKKFVDGKKVGFVKWEDLYANMKTNHHNSMVDAYPDDDYVFKFDNTPM